MVYPISGGRTERRAQAPMPLAVFLVVASAEIGEMVHIAAGWATGKRRGAVALQRLRQIRTRCNIREASGVRALRVALFRTPRFDWPRSLDFDLTQGNGRF